MGQVHSSGELVELARRYFEAWQARDYEALADRYSDDAVMISTTPPYVSPEFGERTEGRDAIMHVLRTILDATDEPFHEIETFTGVDSIVIIWTVGGRVGIDHHTIGPDGRILEHRDVKPKRTRLDLPGGT
jgi:ketosteroid isomerase-like protein